MKLKERCEVERRSKPKTEMSPKLVKQKIMNQKYESLMRDWSMGPKWRIIRDVSSKVRMDIWFRQYMNLKWCEIIRGLTIGMRRPENQGRESKGKYEALLGFCLLSLLKAWYYSVDSWWFKCYALLWTALFLATAQLSTTRLRRLGEGYTGTEGFSVIGGC